MAMTKKQEAYVWSGAAILLIIILWLLMRKHRGATVSNIFPTVNNNNIVNNENPPYTDYALSPGSWKGTASGLPPVKSASGSACGCTSANTGNFFTGLSDMLTKFMAGSAKSFAEYENGVYDSYPSWVTQYFNNPAGVAQSDASSRILTDPTQTPLNNTVLKAPWSKL